MEIEYEIKHEIQGGGEEVCEGSVWVAVSGLSVAVYIFHDTLILVNGVYYNNDYSSVKLEVEAFGPHILSCIFLV